MTEFAQTLRHYCRDPRCRMKLKAPVENPREAFCCRGCHQGFYRKHCLICEAEMVRKAENQLICGKRRCRNALQERQNLGRYLAPPDTADPPKSAHSTGLKSRLAAYQPPWYVVAAGAAITAGIFHCATAGSSLV
jgi:hypothetical protein